MNIYKGYYENNALKDSLIAQVGNLCFLNCSIGYKALLNWNLFSLVTSWRGFRANDLAPSKLRLGISNIIVVDKNSYTRYY